MLEAVFRHDLPVVRLRIRRGDVDVGWACVVLREFTDADPGPFGPLRIGLIADALAEPAEARSVTAAATAYLRGSDVDLVFSNQAHPAWGGALRHAGFFSGPSQFALYWSRPMDAYLGSGRALEVCHVNRGDCDGPVFW
jgi:hypothetical protein